MELNFAICTMCMTKILFDLHKGAPSLGDLVGLMEKVCKIQDSFAAFLKKE